MFSAMSDKNNRKRGSRIKLPLPRIQKPPSSATEPIAVKLGIWGMNLVDIAKIISPIGIIYLVMCIRIG